MGQVVLLGQDNVPPARLGQMVHQRHAHRAATDDKDLCVDRHAFIRSPLGSKGGRSSTLAG